MLRNEADSASVSAHTINPFEATRLRFATYSAVFATIVAVIIFVAYSALFDGFDGMRMLRQNGFAEWDNFAYQSLFEAHPCPNPEDDAAPDTVDTSNCTIGKILGHGVVSLRIILRNMVIPQSTCTLDRFDLENRLEDLITDDVVRAQAQAAVDEDVCIVDGEAIEGYLQQDALHLAWVMRLITVILAICIAPFYRQLLAARYRENTAQSNRYEVSAQLAESFNVSQANQIVQKRGDSSTDVEPQKPNQLLGFMMILFSGFFAYLLLTLVWFLIELMYVDLYLSFPHALIVVIIYSAGFGFVTMYSFIAADTVELLFYSLTIMIAGLSGVFILAKDDWYLGNAISVTSVDDAAGPLFSSLLIMIGAIIAFLWLDLSKWLKQILPDNYHPLLSIINKVIYISALFVALIGVFPYTFNFELFLYPHLFFAYVGPGLFLVVAKLVFVPMIASKTLPKQFVWFSYLTLIGDLIFLGLRFIPFPEGIPVNTTALELWMLISISTWLVALTLSIFAVLDRMDK